MLMVLCVNAATDAGGADLLLLLLILMMLYVAAISSTFCAEIICVMDVSVSIYF